MSTHATAMSGASSMPRGDRGQARDGAAGAIPAADFSALASNFPRMSLHVAALLTHDVLKAAPGDVKRLMHRLVRVEGRIHADHDGRRAGCGELDSDMETLPVA